MSHAFNRTMRKINPVIQEDHIDYRVAFKDFPNHELQ